MQGFSPGSRPKSIFREASEISWLGGGAGRKGDMEKRGGVNLITGIQKERPGNRGKSGKDVSEKKRKQRETTEHAK